MNYHPNFPPSLSISPNAIPQPESTADHITDNTFGMAAQRNAIDKYGIAGRVWEAALVMCEYVDHPSTELAFDPPFFEKREADASPVLVELGSGTGIVAARIANTTSFPDDGIIVATDLPDVCPLLAHNLRKPGSTSSLFTSKMLVRPLAWGNIDHAIAIAQELGLSRGTRPICGSRTPHTRRLTHIVCSDLVYFPELFGPLLRTLIHLTSLTQCPLTLESKPVKVVISYKIRSLPKESPFWSAFGLWFTFQPVLFRRCNETDGHDEEWTSFGAVEGDRTFIFVAYRRPESFAWEVPPSDRDLIDGVGARDTDKRKGDDAFETLLFMTMESVE